MTSAETNFSGALATWKDINLSELQKTLDTQGIEIVENQKQAVIGRKALADKTKVFKKLPDEEKLSEWKTLLKSYQTEIDSLTTRSKTSENAFLSLYKVLAEAPDPYPLLEAAVDQTVKAAEARDLENEIERLQAENAELRKRANEASSLEAAKKKAEAKIEQIEQKMEDMIHEKVVQKENELNATYDERLRNYEEREQDLHRQLNLTKTQLRDLRSSNESNQAKLLDHSQRQDQEVISKFAEADMLAADLERANSRVATVERRNEMLRAEIESLRSGTETLEQVKALESQVSTLESESAQLSAALETQKSAGAQRDAAHAKSMEGLSKEIQAKIAEVEALKTRLKSYADYDDIKRELEIMKYVEFGGLDDEEDPTGEDNDSAASPGASALQLPSPNASKVNTQQARSLEALLATKNKKILDELTKFRILHSELETALASAEEKLAQADAEIRRQRELNEKLENDLLAVDNRWNSDANDAKSVNDGAASKSPNVTISEEGLAGIELGKKTPEAMSRANSIQFNNTADTSILPIVTSQRDRFRQRNSELEEELRKQYQIISDLRSEIKSLQSDNLKLYEKVRYMQSYREDSVTSQLNPLQVPSSSSRPLTGNGNSGDDMGKWRTRYEESMNPFEAFRGREATRAYHNLNVVERGVLVLTRAILSNRRTRTAFIIYAAGLHVFCMYLIYESSTMSGSQLQRQPLPYQ